LAAAGLARRTGRQANLPLRTIAVGPAALRARRGRGRRGATSGEGQRGRR
jgi:hypothetical protein